MLAVSRTIFSFLHYLYNHMSYLILSDNFGNVYNSVNVLPSILYQSLNAFCHVYNNVLIYILYITHGL